LDVGIGSRHHTDPNADRRLDAVWFEHAGSVLQVVPNHSYTKIGHDESLAIAVNGSLLLDELDLVIQAALDGAGLAWVAEDRVTEHLASGALVRVLEDWCPPFPGFFVYYPSRRQQPAALAALIQTLRV
jgi:DNA-binding transcriptional LysR family regulator